MDLATVIIQAKLANRSPSKKRESIYDIITALELIFITFFGIILRMIQFLTGKNRSKFLFALFAAGIVGVSFSASAQDSDPSGGICLEKSTQESCAGLPECEWTSNRCQVNCGFYYPSDATARRKCRSAARKDSKAESECADIENETNEATCRQAVAENNSDLCENLPSGDKDNCRDAVRKSGKADGKFGDASAIDEDFNPFPAYSGPVFEGPGLRAGARIAKTKIDNTISKERSLKQLIIYWMNFALSLTAVLAVIALVWAGILYITDLGDGSNQQKAKKVIQYVLIGIIVILGSYGLVNSLIQARFGSDTNTQPNSISVEPSAPQTIVSFEALS